LLRSTVEPYVLSKKHSFAQMKMFRFLTKIEYMDFDITDTIACKEAPTKKTICENSNSRFDFQCLA